MSEIKVRGDGPVFTVDDDPMFQEILQFAYSMSEIPNELVPLSSGKECLEALEGIGERQGIFPAVILMDINMPGMNGIATVRAIRERDEYSDIPIITMLSSSNEDRDVKSSIEAGANHYCEKPFDITKMKFIKV